MLEKFSLVLLFCHVLVFTNGFVLPEEEDGKSCSRFLASCTDHEDCCPFMRCLDFGFGAGPQCSYGHDNPDSGNRVEQAIQPPTDIDEYGCGLTSDPCVVKEDCCAPAVCLENGRCGKPDYDDLYLGGHGYSGGYGYPGGYPVIPGFP